jgi:hypothetical protein
MGARATTAPALRAPDGMTEIMDVELVREAVERLVATAPL